MNYCLLTCKCQSSSSTIMLTILKVIDVQPQTDKHIYKHIQIRPSDVETNELKISGLFSAFFILKKQDYFNTESIVIKFHCSVSTKRPTCHVCTMPVHNFSDTVLNLRTHNFSWSKSPWSNTTATVIYNNSSDWHQSTLEEKNETKYDSG